MRYVLPVLLFLSVISSLCFAVTGDLSAHMTSTDSVDISNCAQPTGPSRVQIGVFIENPLDTFMEVRYYYFNNNTNTWAGGEKLCNVPASDFQQCTGTINLTLGGKGNGTFTGTMIKLVGTSAGAPTNEYVKMFSLRVRHFTGEREQVLITQKATQDAALALASTKCSSTPTCCPQATRDLIDQADVALSNGGAALSSCDLVGMYGDLVAAESFVRNATTRLNACIASVTPTPIQTPTPILEGTPSPTPAPTPTPSPVATPIPSPTPKQGGLCPLGLVLLSLFGFSALALGVKK